MAEGRSYFVPDGSQSEIRSAARRAMIAEGRTPGSVLYVGEPEDGLVEVVLSERPLRSDQILDPVSGIRYGNAGTRAEPIR